MKKTTFLLGGILLLSLLSFSFINKPVATENTGLSTKSGILKDISSKSRAKIASAKNGHSSTAAALSALLEDQLQLRAKGLSMDALETAVTGYLHLQEQGALKNPNLLTIVDFSQSSRKKRFYLIDLPNKKLLVNTYVAHGKNSGVDKADSFSNTISSEKSSLGFYVTKETYMGKHGLSLRMAGLEKGFNDNAAARAIVVHGADYVNAGRVQSAYMGRSQGCPALPRADYLQVINLIKDGSALFIYSPDATYLTTSTVLQGG